MAGTITPIDKSFGLFVKATREALGMTQVALGKELGLSNVTICNWESHRAPCHHPNLVRYSMLYLVCEKENNLTR